MAGSRKGERRGAARKRIGDAPPKVPRKARLMPQKYTEDYMHQIVTVINAPGKIKPLPREVMLEGMHWFYGEMTTYSEMVPDLIRDMLNERDEAKADKIAEKLHWVKGEVRTMFLQAVEIARNAAPYYHAKVTPDRNAGSQDGSPLEWMRLMLQEIDDATRGRPTWQRQDLKLVSSSKTAAAT